MAWVDHLNKIAETTARRVMSEYSPLLQQSNSAQSNTVQGVVTAVDDNGLLTIQTADGRKLTKIMSINGSAGPGTTGILLAGSLFRS